LPLAQLLSPVQPLALQLSRGRHCSSRSSSSTTATTTATTTTSSTITTTTTDLLLHHNTATIAAAAPDLGSSRLANERVRALGEEDGKVVANVSADEGLQRLWAAPAVGQLAPIHLGVPDGLSHAESDGACPLGELCLQVVATEKRNCHPVGRGCLSDRGSTLS
jgi:hypothetical protein